jgi:hypothetical protein
LILFKEIERNGLFKKNPFQAISDLFKGYKVQRFPQGQVLILTDSPIRFWSSIAVIIQCIGAGNSVIFSPAYDLIEVEQALLAIFEGIFTEEIWYQLNYSELSKDSFAVDVIFHLVEDSETSPELSMASNYYYELEEETSDIIFCSFGKY